MFHNSAVGGTKSALCDAMEIQEVWTLFPISSGLRYFAVISYSREYDWIYAEFCDSQESSA